MSLIRLCQAGADSIENQQLYSSPDVKIDSLQQFKMNGFYKLFINKTNNWFIQLMRYIVVGGVSFIVDYGFLYFLTEFVGSHYLVSATFSFIIGLVVNYIFSTCWIFKNSILSNKTIEFTIYAIIGIVGLLFNNILMYLFTDVLKIHYMFSKLLAAAIVLMWNFVGRKYILFNNK